ncbi:MAG: pectinacetylesterase family protein [Gammaproteobacteria bacterium]|nr:pectinacetylesterase family protein [Gammaproteobacteria bacterium]
MSARQQLITVCVLCSMFIIGCSDGSDDGNGSTSVPFQELYDQGIDRFLGVFTPMTSQRLDAGVTRHTFGGGDGPLCYTGNAFNMSTRDGASEELLIFLQGGGACGPTSCSAVDVGLPLFNVGILEAGNPTNPATDFDLGYVPYCDGTLFTGDRDVDSDGDGNNDRFFRGIQNLSASLDIIVSTYPAPSRILLAGNSAGGFGVHYALPLVRKLYPEVPIELVNDSGVGIWNPGTQESLIDYWNSAAFIPASCDACTREDGNLTGYHQYQLDEDKNLRMGFISSTADEVVTGSGIDPAVFGAELIETVAELEQSHPDRFRSLISFTDEHTYIIKQFDFGIGGTSVRQWVTDMLDRSDNWVSASD